MGATVIGPGDRLRGRPATAPRRRRSTTATRSSSCRRTCKVQVVLRAVELGCRLNASDTDLGSVGVTVLPALGVVVSIGKEGVAYLLEAGSLGGIGGQVGGAARVRGAWGGTAWIGLDGVRAVHRRAGRAVGRRRARCRRSRGMRVSPVAGLADRRRRARCGRSTSTRRRCSRWTRHRARCCTRCGLGRRSISARRPRRRASSSRRRAATVVAVATAPDRSGPPVRALPPPSGPSPSPAHLTRSG